MDPHAIIFVPVLAGAWMFGFAVAALASHIFLTIVESSAVAYVRNVSFKDRRPFREFIRDGVHWPDSVFIDYFACVFYFAYIIGIWAGPAFALARLIAGKTPMATVIAGTAFWLLFPIGLLSSLSSASRWTPFWSGIPAAFIRRPLKTLGFYVLSAPVLAVIFLTFDILLLRASEMSVAWAIALTPFAVLAFFIYARLIGRLGLIVSFTRPEQEAKTRKKPKRPKVSKHAYDPVARQFGPKEEVYDEPAFNSQPTGLAPIITPDEGEVHGYDVDYSGKVVEEPPKPAPFICKFDDEDDTPITMAPAAEISDDRKKVAEEMAKPTTRELDLVLRERPTEPVNPYSPSSFLFVLDPKTIAPWLALTIGVIGIALLQRLLDGLRPT